MALTYQQLSLQAADESFIQRVQEALLQDVNNAATRMQAIPAAASDVTASGYSDRLARAIVADPHGWAIKFARLVAMQLIAKATLLDPAVTTDSDVFSAEGAVYARFYGT
jgi:hypothetical protein